MARKRQKIALGPVKPIFIREWRKYRRLTLERVGEFLGVSASHISQIETGKMNYTRETLEALSYALDCEPADLLGRDPAQPQNQLIRAVSRLMPGQQAQALRLIEALPGPPGHDDVTHTRPQIAPGEDYFRVPGANTQRVLVPTSSTETSTDGPKTDRDRRRQN